MFLNRFTGEEKILIVPLLCKEGLRGGRSVKLMASFKIMRRMWDSESLPHLTHAFAKALRRAGRSPYKGEGSEDSIHRKPENGKN